LGNVAEIRELEERLRLAELGPDASFFETYLDENVLLDGKRAKAMVVEAHRPGGSAKFTRVEMRDFELIDHGAVVVVTCEGEYEGPKGRFRLRFLRIWARKPEGWRIVAGTVSK
jgi:hypothetical protein